MGDKDEFLLKGLGSFCLDSRTSNPIDSLSLQLRQIQGTVIGSDPFRHSQSPKTTWGANPSGLE